MSDGPVQEGATEASRDEQVRGLVEQVREDVRLGHAHDEQQELRRRLDEAGLAMSDDEVRRALG